MRLIDADDLINNLVNACNNDQSKFLPVWIEKQIDVQPTIRFDAVPVVQCKDCKRYYTNGGNCDQVLAEWFCADGKERD